jgi:hypothetical protein
MNKEEAMQYIQQQIDKIDIDKFTIGDDSHIYLEDWQDSTLNILKKVFGKSSDEFTEFQTNIYVYQPSLYYYDWTHNDIVERNDIIKKLKLKLERFIQDIKAFGLKFDIPESKVKQIAQPTGVIINNHNHQTQEVNISVLVQNIFEGLDDLEKEALKKILQQYNQDKNKNNLIQSLQSIGQGVIENILANIITNPRLIDQIINILS